MEYLREQLRGSTDVFIDRAQKLLAESWPKIQDPKKQDSARYAARWLERNKSTIQTALHQRLTGALSAQYEPEVPPAVPELSLMDSDSLAATLLRAKMVSRVMERGRSDLTALEERLDQLQRSGLSLNPRALGPGMLADGFLSVLKDLKVPPEVQTLLLDVYGEEGVQSLIELYGGVNKVLIERGIAPELQITNRRTFRHAGEPKPEERRQATAPQMFQAMMSQLARGDWQPGLLRQSLPFVSPASTGRLSPAQLRAVDHLESVSFTHLSDRRISERVRHEIAKLVPPLLESEVARPGEFAVDDNPARTFIRELAALGHHDQDQAVRGFADIQTTIERIVAEHAAEMESFRIGINVLHTLLQRELDRAVAPATKPGFPAGAPAHADEAAQEEHRFRMRLEATRRRVALELNDRAAGLELDPAVAAFALEMLGPWMMDRYLRHGAGSKQWAEARAFASEFFEAARPAVSEADQQRRQVRRTRVMREARLRLQHGASAGRGAKVLGDLERYFQNLLVAQDTGGPPRRPTHTVDFMTALGRPA
jgi:hypothetical protein